VFTEGSSLHGFVVRGAGAEIAAASVSPSGAITGGIDANQHLTIITPHRPRPVQVLSFFSKQRRQGFIFPFTYYIVRNM
jgi:hypothetical protein